MKGNSKTTGYVYSTVTKENFIDVPEMYCSKFACGKKLSLLETLCGDTCFEHGNLKPVTLSNGLL